MTWIRTIPLSEADDELRQAVEGQKSLYPQEYAVPMHQPISSWRRRLAGRYFADRGLALFDSAGPSPCVLDLRRADVSRPAAPAASSRDDRHHGLGDQPVRVLNRVPRRVSASRHVG